MKNKGFLRLKAIMIASCLLIACGGKRQESGKTSSESKPVIILAKMEESSEASVPQAEPTELAGNLETARQCGQSANRKSIGN